MGYSHTQRGVINLIVIFGVGFFALGSALTISSGILSATHKNHNTVSSHESFYTAESAMREGTYQFLHDDSYISTSYNALNDTSESDITIEDFGTHIRVVGSADNATHREVIQNVITFPEGFAFDYAIYAENDLDIAGNADITGPIFGNGEICVSGSADIDGNANAGGEVSTDPPCSISGISGETDSDAAGIPPPEVDNAVYLAAADMIFADADDAEEYLEDNAPTSGIIYITDTAEVKITSGVDHTGIIVTDGNLLISGSTLTSFIESNPDADPLVLIVNGNLRVTGNAVIIGIVYVRGAITFGAGSPTVSGSIISTETIETEVTGSANIVYDPDIASAWQSIEGLETTSSEPLRIVWSEK